MRSVYVKLGVTTVLGCLLGLFGGQATIAGMVPTPSTIERAADAPTYDAVSYQPARRDDTDYPAIAAACPECSDYDLGYRFAAARGVRESAECMDFSWSYQRGCLARLREG